MEETQINSIQYPAGFDWNRPLTQAQQHWVRDTFFNQPVDRNNTFSEKYDLKQTLFATEDVLPMWVADMDLPTPPFIIEALQKRLSHPILGYNLMPEESYNAIIDWQSQHHYHVQANEICFTHNVANGFHLCVQAFTQPGDAILVQSPIYPPFLSAPTDNARKTVTVPLIDNSRDSARNETADNGYQIDFIALEAAIIKHSVKLFLFCHPHNPVGRAWHKTELQQLADICLRHQVIVVSDEIHSDMVFDRAHIPLASLNPAIAQNTITLSSPGKTFNLGGLQLGYAIIANPKLHAQFNATSQSVSIHDLNTFAIIALIAAYSPAGQNWKSCLLAHFSKNFAILKNFLEQNNTQIKIQKTEATYLAWLDFTQWNWSQSTLKKWLVSEAKLGLSNGDSFFDDTQNSGRMRMNLAVSSQTLNQALQQLKTALNRT